jgi:hypothetical protein
MAPVLPEKPRHLTKRRRLKHPRLSDPMKFKVIGGAEQRFWWSDSDLKISWRPRIERRGTNIAGVAAELLVEEEVGKTRRKSAKPGKPNDIADQRTGRG